MQAYISGYVLRLFFQSLKHDREQQVDKYHLLKFYLLGQTANFGSILGQDYASLYNKIYFKDFFQIL